MRVVAAFWSFMMVAGSSSLSLQAQALAATPNEAVVPYAHHHHHHDSDGDDSSSGGDSALPDNTKDLTSFAGIWVADGNEPMQLAPGCLLMMHVDSEKKVLTRAIICANGDLQTDAAQIKALSVEPSPFPDGFELKTVLGDSKSSCTDDQQSSIADLGSLAFDLKTAAGGEAATIAYANLGSLALSLHSGGAIDTFDRNRTCKDIVKVAAGVDDSAANTMVKLAAKVCNLEAQAGGCFTADGYVPAGN